MTIPTLKSMSVLRKKSVCMVRLYILGVVLFKTCILVDTRAESPETMSDAPKPSESELLLARCRTAEAERDAARRELKQTKKKLRDANLELQRLNSTLASSYDDVNTAIGLLNTAQTKLSIIEIFSD